ncbi:GHKL domain-containing protein [candidate division KSB1 bacterium]|nr:GHKL domain-containing protein [candidate division KSB1 bacterium]
MNKNHAASIPKQFKRLQPRYVVILSLLLLIVLFLSAVVELTQTRHEITHLLQEEAATLMEAVSISGANAISAIHEIENLVEQKLLTIARLVNRLDELNALSQQKIAEIAAQNNIYRINLFNARGNRVLSSSTTSHDTLSGESQIHNFIQPVLSGQTDELVIGFKESRHPGEKRFAVAVKRTKGGAIVANIDAEAMLEFRKSIGVGRLMQDIGNYEGIEYIVLQDYEGIILASTSVSRMNSIESDSFLIKAFEKNAISSRLRQTEEQKIYEFVKPFILYDEPVGLFRIGLKTDHLDQASARIKRRMLIMSVIMGLFILIGFNFVTINQNYRLINEAYRRIQTYSSNILEHMADAVIAIDRNYQVTIFNHAASQLVKLSTDAVINKPLDPELRQVIYPLVLAIDDGRTIHDQEIPIHYNEQRLITSISTSVLKNERGEAESAFAVIKDLTEKQHLVETLQRQEKLTAMGQLASGVAHEIRNPLNAIGMISQRLNKEFVPTADADEYRELTETVVTEVRRINDIIQQFLTFARPSKLTISQVNLSELLESTITLVSIPAQKKHIQIISHLNPIPQLALDHDKMKQVFLNLLQNAIEAIEKDGRIHIQTAMNEKHEVVVEIADSGRGIPKEILSKIFNLYFTTKPGGTGLGLSLVHQIISQHDGHIEVESEPGSGTRFVIYLPEG